jgi:hypothetical protein
MYNVWVKSQDLEDYNNYRTQDRETKRIVKTVKNESWKQIRELIG